MAGRYERLFIVAAVGALTAAPAHAGPLLLSSPRVGVAPSVGVPVLPIAPGLASGLGLAPALGAAPTLSLLPAPAAAPEVSPRTALLGQTPIAATSLFSEAVPQAQPIPGALAGLPAAMPLIQALPAPAAEAGGTPRRLEASYEDAAVLFDGAARLQPAAGAAPEPAPDASSWRDGRFSSPADGAELHYRYRPAGGKAAGVPTVFIGGIAPDLSYESYFETQKPTGDQYFLHLRAHPTSPWTYTQKVLDYDARDLAHMIVLSGRRSGSSRVSLVLHSYGGILFERLLQLRQEPEVRKALGMLAGGRATILDSTTHYGHSEAVMGEQYARLAQVLHNFMSWIDLMDDAADLMRQTARINPLLAPIIQTQLLAWQIQRDRLLAFSTEGGVLPLLNYLKTPWEPAVDHIRLRILHEVEAAASQPGWQEAFLRRSNDVLGLEFTKKDVELLRRLKIHLNLVHARQDHVIPWVSAKVLFDLLGIPVTKDLPPAGSVFTDPSGLFRLTIVESDHMFPLRQPGALASLLAP